MVVNSNDSVQDVTEFMLKFSGIKSWMLKLSVVKALHKNKTSCNSSQYSQWNKLGGDRTRFVGGMSWGCITFGHSRRTMSFTCLEFTTWLFLKRSLTLGGVLYAHNQIDVPMKDGPCESLQMGQDCPQCSSRLEEKANRITTHVVVFSDKRHLWHHETRLLRSC